MRIYLIRHGQTTGDVEDRYGGDYDDHLTELGRQQAVSLSQELSNKEIQIIFTSPRLRAVETAEILKKKWDVEYKIINDLRERNRYGVMTGMIKSEAKSKYPDLVRLIEDAHYTIEAGEDYKSFGDRIRKAFREVKNSGFQAVAVVTHAGSIRYIFREFLGFNKINLTDGAYAELKVEANQVKIVKLTGISTV